MVKFRTKQNKNEKEKKEKKKKVIEDSGAPKQICIKRRRVKEQQNRSGKIPKFYFREEAKGARKQEGEHEKNRKSEDMFFRRQTLLFPNFEYKLSAAYHNQVGNRYYPHMHS